MTEWTTHLRLNEWIDEMVELCKPTSVHICDGSQEEYEKICQLLVHKGLFVPLSQRPHSYWCHSDPQDVARVEQATFICSRTEEEAGPTNNWSDPIEMRLQLLKLFTGAMHGREMYVIPFCMGPLGSEHTVMGVEITDSPYVVCNMHHMTRMGKEVLDVLQEDFIPCMHSVGCPLEEGEPDLPWPCRHDQKYIVHFPESREVWSFGSGYGGNALLGKKSLALRIASAMGRDQGWLAEHMLIVGVTNPEGEKHYLAAAFPSACGKTNFAMMKSTLPGWKVEMVGDDIAWMRFGEDGKLYAVNPEFGIFGVAVGTSEKSNPHAMRLIEENTIFTNTGMTTEGDVWWEGMTDEPPQGLVSWLGTPWHAGEMAAHPNSRFTAPLKQFPHLDSAWNDPQGVPISAILFGGKRSAVIPLVCEAFSWRHGVLMGCSLSSEMTAAAEGEMGKLRHDPFAMLPFCSYHMGDYFNHWLQMGEKEGKTLPKIYQVNWFRKDHLGKWVWPGYGENIRVVKWIFERLAGNGAAKETPIGYVPAQMDLTGLNVAMGSLFSIDNRAWKHEVAELEKYFEIFGDKFPEALRDELEALKNRLG